jgi:alpha-L-rhamnosidase
MNSPLRIVDLRCEYLAEPLGLDERLPRLSWRLEDARAGARQTAWQVVAASTPELLEQKPDLWDSGRVLGDTCLDIVWAGRRLTSRQRVCWRVRAWDQDGAPSEWSEIARFELGLLQPRDWQAQWIGRPVADDLQDTPPSPYLRRGFVLDAGTITAARLRVTARGIGEFHLNGQRVGNECFTPGWTDYAKRIQVVTFDVSGLVQPGANAVGAILADGWYAGYLAWTGKRGLYGAQTALLAQLEVDYADGRRVIIASGPEWRTAVGPILAADLYNGERYDARLALDGWSLPAFDDAAWTPATVIDPPKAKLVARRSGPVRRQEELAVQAQTEPQFGVHVFDLGQNIVGWARIRVRAQAGDTVTVRYAEMLNPDGTLYTANLRSAKATDRYTCRGVGEETYEPRFTFHGFRYVELTGLCEKPQPTDVTGVVVHTDIPPTGSFECSDPLVNRLQQNIVWGQRGNYLEVPTDCPQRDERLGWTGDAQVFIRTACFNRDVSAFFTKWCVDLADAQYADGAFPHVVPDVLREGDAMKWARDTRGCAAWADAGVICPWTIHLCYGDTRILERQYESMAKWIAWRERTSRDLIHDVACFGDWLAIDIAENNPGRSPTPRDLIATAYFARTAELTGRTAAVLGRRDDARRYATLARRVRAAFNREFVTPSGRVAGDTQTGYLLALGFDLLPPAKRAHALARLVADIEGRGWKLSTGFVGTPLLAPVLTAHGRMDVAYKLLHQQAYPSWLYTVLQGATTMWERWNSYTKEKGFGDVGMNSFNHYAYGAIGEWLYASVAGIDIDPARPGYKHILIRPQPGGELTWARGELRSRYGRIACGWRIEEKRLLVDVTIPPNTTATVILPGRKPTRVVAGTYAYTVPWRPKGQSK